MAKCRLVSSSEDEIKSLLYNMGLLFPITNIVIKQSSNPKYPKSNFLAYFDIEE